MKAATPSLRSSLLGAALLAAILPGVLAQQEIGYIEDFALAANREEALKQLIPGTEEYYYFHALHYQNTRQLDPLSDIMAQWEKRFRNSGLRQQILHREALLNYPQDAKGSLEYIRRELGLNFNHQQEGKARAQNFPSQLDQAEVAWGKFLEEALRGTQNLSNLHESAFHALLANGHQLTAAQRRDLLQRASLPDLPNLLDVVVADLESKESRGFGEFNIHRALTVAQLDGLRGRKGDLLRNDNYVHTYVSKLRPGADSDPAANPAVRQAFLERAWNFVKDLDPAFNSLKAHLLYQRLVFDHSQGVHDAERFMTYLKLPRNVSYVRPQWREENKELWRTPADLGANYLPVTDLPPIGTDEPLVRDYLLHFLKDAESYDGYAPYLDEGWLKAVFAEAKIVNGIGDPERWASLLSPAAFQALKDRVDIEFDPTSPEQFAVSDPVKLRVHIKNVETLIVKVFEVNTLNYYLEKGTEVSTDIDLDGLVTNHERTVVYEEAPQRRVAREFEFPEIENRRGVWVVEFIGGSKSSRALIRKGKLEVLSETAGGGEVLTVLDAQHKPVPDAAVWFGGRRLECDEEGRVLIPFSTDPGVRSAVVEASGGFAALARFQHSSEDYVLHAGLQIAREALRPGATATLVVRPVLTVQGQPISLTRLSDVRLQLTSTDLDGVSTTDTIPGFEIHSDREALHEFRVPDRLASLQVSLLAKVQVASRGQQEVELSQGSTFTVNEYLRSERVDDLFLSRINGGYVVELLGRTGEPRVGQNVNVTVRRSGFQNTRRFTLKTDAAGGVELGALEGIVEVTVEAPGGHTRSWNLPEARRTQPGVVHATAGSEVRIPHVGELDRAAVSFFAVSNAGYTADVYDSLKLENGFLVAGNLAAGDYRLLLKESGQAVTIRVADGATSAGHVFNEARTLELQGRAPAHLAALEVAGESLEIRVANSDPLTRVHVVATRFLPEFDIFNSIGQAPRPGLLSGKPARLPNLYVNGRKIGDEFRYILERRYAQKFPGNMLERPELLLNPWAVRDTEAEEESLAEGEAYDRKAPGEVAMQNRASEKRGGQGGGVGGSGGARSVDFLHESPVQLFNLQPGEDGTVRIELAALADRQHVHVLVVDPEGASYREVSLADRGTAIRDLRLLNALDPTRHFTEQDSVTLLKGGEQLEIPDLLTARFEVFEDLGAAYRYLLAVRDDPTLREFEFLMRWPSLEDEKKREYYSKYACHELSFFLARKDPEFFRAAIAPHLLHKKDKTFLDHYLLEVGLEAYASPFEYQRLNAAERILLAGRMPNRLEAIRMDLRDRLAMTPPDLGREYFLFEGALAVQGLAWSERSKALDKAATFANNADFGRPGDAAPAPPAAPAPASAVGGLAGGAATRGAALRRSLGRNELKAELADMEADAVVAEKQLEQLEAAAKKSKDLGEELRARYRKENSSTPRAMIIDAYDDAFGAVALGEALYRAIETTKEWAENNYYQVAITDQNYSLIPENRFWLDLANHEGGGFGSRYLGEASRNVHEMLLALAVLDLPFETPESKTEVEGIKLTFTAGGSAIAFHREIKEAGMAEDRPPLLVSQSYFRHGDRHRIENGQQVDKFVTDEFLVGVVYGSQVVVTNPTSSQQKLDILIQIPRGAIPVLGNRATATERVAMEPYTTQRFERYFYFPAAGQFPVYPAHVSKAGAVVAHADPFELKVVEEPSQVDESSWAYLSQWGTEDQVLTYLSKQNLHAINLEQVAWRCRESADFLRKALEILNLRGIYHRTLFSYGIHHNVPGAVNQFLLVDGNYLDRCGDYLASELVTIDPIARRAYEHLEYKPLVNNRAHVVGGSRKILNGRIREHYQHFLRVLSQKAQLDAIDQLSVVYYLFLQDRVGEALARLELVGDDAGPVRMQHDYFRAYAAFYQGKPAEARAIAAVWAGNPVDRWRERFTAVIAQADEIEGKGPQIVDDENRDQQQEKLASVEPTLEMEVDGSTVELTYERVSNVQVNYYEMDLEFLFSTNPFVSSGGGGFSVVRPNKTELLQLADGKRVHRFDLPREYQSKNVLVEVIGGGKKRTQAVYSNELQTGVSENFGILTVRHAKDGRPLPTTYVKVYAMTGSGPVFYKDGYTDLRGKFDYASVSTTDIADAQQFSILVMSDEFGATVLEAPVPQR